MDVKLYVYSYIALLTVSVILIIVGYSITDNTIVIIGWALFGVQGIYGLYVLYLYNNKQTIPNVQGAQNVKRPQVDKVTKDDLKDNIEWIEQILAKHKARLEDIEKVLNIEPKVPVLRAAI